MIAAVLKPKKANAKRSYFDLGLGWLLTPLCWSSVQVEALEAGVLWITAGLGCDGDTIAMTAATQPSLEDILLGAIRWIPKVKLHNLISGL